MKVLFDHQIFQAQTVGGVSRYFIELFKHFPEDIKYEIPIIFSDNIYLKDINILDLKPIVEHRNEFMKGYDFPGKGRLFNALKKISPKKYPVYYYENLINSIKYIEKQDYDVFHPTNFHPYFF